MTERGRREKMEDRKRTTLFSSLLCLFLLSVSLRMTSTEQLFSLYRFTATIAQRGKECSCGLLNQNAAVIVQKDFWQEMNRAGL